MLFIATMEKVVLAHSVCLFHKCANIQLCVSCLISLWSPGGSGMAWRTQTYGTTVGLTTSQEPGCVHRPKKLVWGRFLFARFHESGLTWTGEIWELRPVLYLGMFSQSGFRQCRSWWSSLWSSPLSPFWCFWVNCSPCPRVDFSTSLGCAKSSQVTVGCKNVPPTLIVRSENSNN